MNKTTKSINVRGISSSKNYQSKAGFYQSFTLSLFSMHYIPKLIKVAFQKTNFKLREWTIQGDLFYDEQTVTVHMCESPSVSTG